MGLPPNNAHPWMNPWDDDELTGREQRIADQIEFPVDDPEELELMERQYERHLDRCWEGG